MATQSDVLQQPVPPKPIAFVGWSTAASRFREIAAANARSPSSVLLLGQTGVGKKTMARAWRQAVAPSNNVPDLIELDASSRDVPPYVIATSTLGLSPRIPCVDLGTGKNKQFSTNDVFLPDELASRFPLRLYMPPLDERLVDILALLQFFNRYTLPAVVGRSYEHIRSGLIDFMFKAPWPGNVSQLRSQFIAMASRDTIRLSNADSAPQSLGTLHSIAELPVHESSQDGFAGLAQIRSLIADKIAHGTLPDTSFWRTWTTLFEAIPYTPHVCSSCSEPFDKLGELAIYTLTSVLSFLIAPDAIIFKLIDGWRTVGPTPPSSYRMTVEEFLDFRVEQFVENTLKLPGIMRNTQNDWMVDLEKGCRFVRQYAHQGATFESLRAGLLINTTDVANADDEKPAISGRVTSEIGTPEVGGDDDVTDDSPEIWEDYGGSLPTDTEGKPLFYDTPLVGAIWQIAWALHLVSILGSSPVKDLKAKIGRKRVLRGQRDGGTYYVYVQQKNRQQQLDDALAHLATIKSRPYRPEYHVLPAAYEKYQQYKLESLDESSIARALFDVGILSNETVNGLHEAIREQGSLFGRIKRTGEYVIFLNDKHSDATVKSAFEKLNAVGPAELSAK